MCTLWLDYYLFTKRVDHVSRQKQDFIEHWLKNHCRNVYRKYINGETSIEIPDTKTESENYTSVVPTTSDLGLLASRAGTCTRCCADVLQEAETVSWRSSCLSN